MSSKIEMLKKKQTQLNAKIQLLESAEKTRERKKDTRRKILIGAYHLDKAREENTWDRIVQLMDGYLKRDSDRVLFDLPVLGKKSPDDPEGSSSA